MLHRFALLAAILLASASPAAAQYGQPARDSVQVARAAAMKADLARLVQAQAAYHGRHDKYAATAGELGFAPTAADSLRITTVAGGYNAEAFTAEDRDLACGLFVGHGVAPHPAVKAAGEPICWHPVSRVGWL